MSISENASHPKCTELWRQSGRGILLAGGLALAACAGGESEQGDIGFVEGFFGGLIADEPRAALVGREVLSAGGTAADAAVAAYFTMAVTMPGAAGLGGGGVCLVHDAVEVRTEAISFLPGRPAGADPLFAVPGNVRGMFLLHARYGELAWSDLLVPAEDFARSGHAVSRAFVRDLRAVQAGVPFGPEARRLFAGPIEEGQLLQQVELGAVMSNLRTLGPGAFYDGVLGRSFADAVRTAGGDMSLDDLRNYRPQLLAPIRFGFGNHSVVFPPTPGGQVSARIWAAATDGDRYEDAEGAERTRVLLEASAQAYRAVARGDGLEGLGVESAPGDSGPQARPGALRPPIASGVADRRDPAPGGAGIVAVDNQGRTVACSFTMNAPFGSGIIAPGTGILLAGLPDGLDVSVPSVAMLVNEKIGLTFFAAAGAGASAAPVARIALDTLTGPGEDMIGAVAAPRAYDAGAPGRAVVEAALPEPDRAALRASGRDVEARARIGRISGFYCPRGLPREQTCQFVKDPRSFGLAVSSDE